MRTLQQLLFFAVKIAVLMTGAAWGIGGGGVVADAILGAGTAPQALNHASLMIELALIAIFSIGAVLGAVGALALVVLPLHFIFPRASRPLPWEKVALEYQLYRWYGRKLVMLGGEPT